MMRQISESEMHSDWEKNGTGCIFDHFGRVPEDVYQPSVTKSELEEAVLENDLKKFNALVEDGHRVHHGLKIGEMSCLEYAAMTGYDEVLRALLHHSHNADILAEYYALDDVVERAYFMSRNKSAFFGHGALAEANRYEAALYTAIEYNRPECVKILVAKLGTKEPNKHVFYVENDTSRETLSLSPSELAEARGHRQCYELLVENMSPRL